MKIALNTKSDRSVYQDWLEYVELFQQGTELRLLKRATVGAQKLAADFVRTCLKKINYWERIV